MWIDSSYVPSKNITCIVITKLLAKIINTESLIDLHTMPRQENVNQTCNKGSHSFTESRKQNPRLPKPETS